MEGPEAKHFGAMVHDFTMDVESQVGKGVSSERSGSGQVNSGVTVPCIWIGLPCKVTTASSRGRTPQQPGTGSQFHSSSLRPLRPGRS